MGSVFHFPAVGFAAVCIVSGQAASMFFHLAGRADALEVRRFFGSASSPARRICSRRSGDPLHRLLLREDPAGQESRHPRRCDSKPCFSRQAVYLTGFFFRGEVLFLQVDLSVQRKLVEVGVRKQWWVPFIDLIG